jgi:hypothetical protein
MPSGSPGPTVVPWSPQVRERTLFWYPRSCERHTLRTASAVIGNQQGRMPAASCGGCESYVNRAASTCREPRPAGGRFRKVSEVCSTKANAGDMQILSAGIRYPRRLRVTGRAYNLIAKVQGRR